jgi:hypothetical protein
MVKYIKKEKRTLVACIREQINLRGVTNLEVT